MAVVSGIITFSTPINTDILVQAFDKDMRSDQLLGEVTVSRPPSSLRPFSIQLPTTQTAFSATISTPLICLSSQQPLIEEGVRAQKLFPMRETKNASI